MGHMYSILTFSQIVFQSDGTIFHHHKQCTGIQFFLTNIYFMVIFNNCHPSGLILICWVLMIIDTEQLFKCLLAIYLSLEKISF